MLFWLFQLVILLGVIFADGDDRAGWIAAWVVVMFICARLKWPVSRF